MAEKWLEFDVSGRMARAGRKPFPANLAPQPSARSEQVALDLVLEVALEFLAQRLLLAAQRGQARELVINLLADVFRHRGLEPAHPVERTHALRGHALAHQLHGRGAVLAGEVQRLVEAAVVGLR